MIPATAYVIVGFGAIFVMSVVLHEVAHGYVAYLCGDPTAKLLGRLTLNPIRHIDPVRTLLMPALFIIMRLPILGGAKPVPVNPYHFRHRVRDDRLVSGAGVFANLLIAWALAMLLHLLLRLGLITWDSPHAIVLGMGSIVNILLLVFNLLPIPPLDGSRLLRSFLPEPIRENFNRMDRYGIMILYAVILFVPGLGDVIYSVIAFFWRYVFLHTVGHFWYVVTSFSQLIRGG